MLIGAGTGAGPSKKGIQMIKEKYPDIFFGTESLKNYPNFKDKKMGKEEQNKDIVNIVAVRF